MGPVAIQILEDGWRKDTNILQSSAEIMRLRLAGLARTVAEAFPLWCETFLTEVRRGYTGPTEHP